MNVCLFEDDQVEYFFPLTETRAVYDLRTGLFTQLEAVRILFDHPRLFLHARQVIRTVTTQENQCPESLPDGEGVLFVNGRWLPDNGPALERIRAAVLNRENARVFVSRGVLIAAWIPSVSTSMVRYDAITRSTFDGIPGEEVPEARFISRLWDLINELRPSIRRDCDWLFEGHPSLERPGVLIQPGALLVNPENIYIGEGTVIKPGAILNAENGPIMIGRNVTVQEAAVIRGPACIGSDAQVRAVANIETCVIGPYCKVGGEIHDSILHAFTNKTHSGFLGDSYLGSWCNLGASTNNSNLRNDYGTVSLYNTVTHQFEPSGRQFLGLFMGDHTKCGINTMFNTGTIVGVSCNLYGSGFHERYIPSFSWGGPENGYVEFRLDKALQVVEAVMLRRNRTLTEAERVLLARLSEKARISRN